mgnify:CR=1 FL=1
MEEKRRISSKEQEEAVRSVVIHPRAPVKGIKFIPFSFVWVDLIFLEIRASFLSIVGTLRVLSSYGGLDFRSGPCEVPSIQRSLLYSALMEFLSEKPFLEHVLGISSPKCHAWT